MNEKKLPAFRTTFLSPYETVGDHKAADLNGRPFTVLGRSDEHEEGLDMYRIRFADGTEVTAWPEEVVANLDDCDSAFAVSCPPWDSAEQFLAARKTRK